MKPNIKSFLSPCALASLSGFLFSLALPNELFKFGSPAMGYVALVPLFCALFMAENRLVSAAALALFGMTQHAIGSFWLYFFEDYAIWTIGSSTLAYGVVYGAYGLFMAFFSKRSGIYRPIVFAIIWTVIEYAKSIGFFAYPWGLIPYSQTTVLPFLQIADIWGVYGITFVLAFLNTCIAELVLSLRNHEFSISGRPGIHDSKAHGKAAWTQTAIASFLVCATFLYGLIALNTGIPVDNTFTALLVQHNLDPWNNAESASLLKSQKLVRESRMKTGIRPDLIVFSESVLSRPYLENTRFYERNFKPDPFVPFVRDSGAPILIGGPFVLDWKLWKASNSAIYIDKDGRFIDSFEKMRLVPFAEVLPCWDVPFMQTIYRSLVGLSGGWTPGTELTLFTLPLDAGKTVDLCTPICFEDAFSDLCRDFVREGADVLVNLTNDSWSRTDSAEIQHYAVARFRSIETHKSLVRATNSGFTCVIGARGQTLARIPLFTEGTLQYGVPVYAEPNPTAYVSGGDSVPVLFFFFLAVFSVIILVRSRFGNEGGIA